MVALMAFDAVVMGVGWVSVGIGIEVAILSIEEGVKSAFEFVRVESSSCSGVLK